MEGASQKDDLTLELTALSQTGHRLVHHRLKDRGRYVLFPSALVQDRLDVTLGKHAAAGGNGIDLLMFEREFIQLVYRDVHQSGHLIDKSTGTAGTGAVHPLLQCTAKEDDLGVLAAQLDDGIRIRYVGVDSGSGGVHLLHEVDVRRFGHAQTGGAGDGNTYLLAPQLFFNGTQSLRCPLSGLGVVPFIRAEEQLVLLVQHHHFYRGGTNVNSNPQTHRFTWYPYYKEFRIHHNITKKIFLQDQTSKIQDVPYPERIVPKNPTSILGR